MPAFHAAVVLLQGFSALLSARFVFRGRLGRPWLLVAAALAVTAGWNLVRALDPAPAAGTAFPSVLNLAELSASVLLAAGFALTERWFALEERLERRFRLLADVDQSLVGLLEDDQILSAVCEGLVRGGHYRVAWVGVAEPDGTIAVVRRAGEGRGMLAGIALRWDGPAEATGPAGTALRDGGSAVALRIDRSPEGGPWRSAAAREGVRHLAAVPVPLPGGPGMVLAVGSGARKAFGRLETEAIGAMARRAGIALVAARRHALFASAKGAYDDLLRVQQDGVVCLRGGVIVRANPAAASMLGYGGPEVLLGLSPEALFADPGGPADVLGGLLAAAAAGETPTGKFEARLARRDGEPLEAEVTYAWVPRSKPRQTEESFRWKPELTGPLGMLVLKDVTPRRVAMETLLRERDFSETVVDLAGAIVLRVSPRGEILYVNDRGAKATGYPSGELLGRPFPEALLSEGTRERFAGALTALEAGRTPPPAEYPLVTKGGEERLILLQCAAIRDGDGRVASVVVTGVDTTERRRLEAQLVGMQKMEALGTLAGGVAHDFNNILTGILANLDMADAELPPGSGAAAPIRACVQAAERAAVLIRQLLEFSRRSPQERRPLDLRAAAEEVSRLVAQTIDRRIAVDVASPPDLWPALADGNQVHQILMNLCLNARDAIVERLDRREVPPSPGGYGIRIRLGNVRVDEAYCRPYPYARPGEFVLLAVEDDGAGMDAATRSRVFEPFFTTKALGRGTGLGLSTVYGIVKQHDGWINLESIPGQGTVFRVYLPRATQAPAEASLPAPPASGRRGRETVLLADDEEMIREIGRRILERSGYTVLTAVDGQEAVDLYARERGRIDLVIVDLTMPRLSGGEVVERIRALDPAVPVVVSSGYSARENRLDEVRPAAFLQKPYRAEALERLVRDVLEG